MIICDKFILQLLRKKIMEGYSKPTEEEILLLLFLDLVYKHYALIFYLMQVISSDDTVPVFCT